MKIGRTKKLDWSADYAIFTGCSLQSICEQWVGALGADSVVARPYLEALKSVSAALLADFFVHTGIAVQPPAVEKQTTTRANPRLSAEGIEFLAALNSYLPHPSKANEAEIRIRRGLLTQIMETWLAQSPSKTEAAEPVPLLPMRVVEIMRELSYPAGPLDLTRDN